MKISNFLILFFSSCLLCLGYNCSTSEKIIQRIYNNSQKSNQSYQVLEYLSKQAPGRLPGTQQSGKAVEYVQQTLKKYGADSVWLFPVKAPGWKELKKPVAQIVPDNDKRITLNAVSLGQSVSTNKEGIDGQIVIINNKSQIDSLGEKGLKGKIVFFNLKMKVRSDYGKMSWQRVQGASMVSKYGAVGVLERSLTTKYDNNPHTGVVRYEENSPKIPAIGLSWQAADNLEQYFAKQPELKVHIETYTENPGLISSNNVVAEIKGSKYPDKIFLLSAHIDAWHIGQGAQDDGGGISQIIDVIRIFKELKIKPKHTIRVIAYTDEEQFLSGMKQYALGLKDNKQKHLIDIEVDNGIGVPDKYDIQADSVVFTKQEIWRSYLKKYNLNKISFTNSYATNWPLFATDSTILMHLLCKDDHYFDYHHSANDVFETVDKQNLQSGGASLAVFLYILDKLDVIDNSRRKK